MKGTMLIYRPMASEPEVRELDTAPTLQLLQEGVGGGYIEPVPGFDSIVHAGKFHRCVAFCDENGKLSESALLNNHATRLWHKALPPPGLLRPDGSIADVLVGQILIVFGDDEFMDAL